MKKMLVLITSLICIAITLFIVFTKADHDKLNENEALEIGEEKYLEFLWMVDGAFNNTRFNEEFIVNDKRLDDDKKIFTCIYKNKEDNSCIANNFEEEFIKLFSRNLSYSDVYGDGISYTWYKYENGKYIFTNLDSCSINRMNTNQIIRIHNITNSELSFYVSSKDNDNNEIIKPFVLVNEENGWKIVKAYYHDICEMDYNIE